jgi:hypothetical protein
VAVPGTGLLVVATTAVRGLSRVLRDEHREGNVRVNEVLIMTRIEKAPRPGVTHAPVFGFAIAKLINSQDRSHVFGYDGMALKVT